MGNNQTKKSDTDLGRIADSLEEQNNNQKLSTYIFRHPFKAYFSVGSIMFGLVFASNLIIGLVNTNARISSYTFRQAFIFMNFFKSLWYGFIWPAVPLILLTPNGFKKMFIVGGSFE